MPTFKKNKNLKVKFTPSRIDMAVKDVLNRGMGIREAGRMHNIHNVTLRQYVLKAKQQNLDQCFLNFFGLAPPWLPDKFPALP